ncbi:suppressor of cytokine signaling 3-like [Montipora capricornis]|uniref:suppressor of cytokine signaling 3-like n=1 Tax=Montipora capricornis TaxID=246305 RepID=UPI0035F1F858
MDKKAGLNSVLRALQQSGFYLGAITAARANFLLRDQAVGKFLVRDSWDPKHLFTVTLVTNKGITNIRTICSEGLLHLDGQGSLKTPRFDCAVKMIVCYMMSSELAQRANGQSRTMMGQMFFLLSPLYKEVSCLRHLCRKALNRMPLFKTHQNASIPYSLRIY